MNPHLKIVIAISANAEWRVVRYHFPNARLRQSPYGQWFETVLPASPDDPLAHYPVIFMHQGWGKIAAAGATQYAIDRWHPDLLINLGTCGGFAGEVQRFTVILAEKTLVYDIFEQMGDFEEHIDHYTTSLDLAWLPPEATYPQKVVRTLLVSADRDLIPEEIHLLKKKYGAIAGDWESGAIAWVTARNGVSCLILRGITDLVGNEGGEAYQGKQDVFITGTRQVMNELLHNLPGWITLAEKGLFARHGSE